MPIRPLSKELEEVAKQELNEVPSRIQTDLAHIRKWISQQPHLKARIDDQWLLSFLRGAKFSLQRTKEKLDYYYTLKKLVPEFHSNRDPLLPDIQQVLKARATIVLPKTADPGGPRIVILRYDNLNPEKITLNSCMKVLLMITDILMMEDDNYVVAGQSVIEDFKHISYSYIREFTIPYVKKIAAHFQDVYPLRIKEFHFINTPSAVETVYNIIKFLFPEKLRRRVFLYTDTLISSRYIVDSILPKYYGGDEISCDEIAAYWKTKVESYRDWFLEDEQFGTDETKRIEKSKTDDLIFGVEGSFVKLEID